MKLKTTRYLFLTVLLAGCTTQADLDLATQSLLDDAEALPSPIDLKADASGTLNPLIRGLLKQYVVHIAEANTTRRDNDSEIRQALLPAIALLAWDFAVDRPAEEIELTRGTWRNIWDDAQSIDPPPPIVLDRNNIYQVVEDGFYYNVTNQVLPGPGGVVDIQYFLKGYYTLARQPTDDNMGELALNVIELEFGASVFRPGQLDTTTPLSDLVAEIDLWVESGSGAGVPPNPIPGPEGQTGYLFNLYVDEDVRIAAGIDGEDPSELSLFVLRRAFVAGELPPMSSRTGSQQ